MKKFLKFNSSLDNLKDNPNVILFHIDALKEQIERKPFKFPKIRINKKDNIDDFTLSDIEIENYQYHDAIYMKMRK